LEGKKGEGSEGKAEEKRGGKGRGGERGELPQNIPVADWLTTSVAVFCFCAIEGTVCWCKRLHTELGQVPLRCVVLAAEAVEETSSK